MASKITMRKTIGTAVIMRTRRTIAPIVREIKLKEILSARLGALPVISSLL